MLYLKGNILYMADRTTLCSSNDSYLAIEGSVIKGIFEEPEFHTRFCAAAGDTLIDYGSRLIIPGMVDLHLHAPQ